MGPITGRTDELRNNAIRLKRGTAPPTPEISEISDVPFFHFLSDFFSSVFRFFRDFEQSKTKIQEAVMTLNNDDLDIRGLQRSSPLP